MSSHSAAKDLSRATRALLELAKQKTKPELRLVTELPDAALDGAQREGDVIVLGRDPVIEERAAEGAALHAAKVAAEKAYDELVPDLQEYGAEARAKYNGRFGTEITTIKIPFTGDDGEERRCAVTCSRRFSVKAEVAFALQLQLGSTFDELFVVTNEEILKPAAAGVFDQVLLEHLKKAGVKNAKKLLPALHEALFEKKKTIATVSDYEKKLASVPEEAKAMLKQAVTRAAPSVKFA